MKANKPISPRLFRRLVQKLSAEQLLRFPTACLPEEIPLDAVDAERQPEKWAALERLVWRATERDMARRAGDLERLGEAVSAALDVAETETASGADELGALCDRLAENCRGVDPTRDQLSEENQTLERASARARALAERVGRLGRALGVLDHRDGADAATLDRVEAGRRRARQVLSRLEWALGRFHMLELGIAGAAMRAKDAECELQLRRLNELEERIAALERQIEHDNGVMVRLLRPAAARQQREAREQRLQALRRSRDDAEIFVDEDHLLRWLDVLVNTSLFTDQDYWHEKARDIRLLLYRLLNTYCMQQELAAHEVATRAMPGVDGRAAIGYYLKSEEFILGYFARKRREVMQWLAGAAESKLEQLEHTRDALLAEYRRHVETGASRAGPGRGAA